MPSCQSFSVRVYQYRARRSARRVVWTVRRVAGRRGSLVLALGESAGLSAGDGATRRCMQAGAMEIPEFGFLGAEGGA